MSWNSHRVAWRVGQLLGPVARTASDRGNYITRSFVTGDHVGSTKPSSAMTASCRRQEVPRDNMAGHIHALHELPAVLPLATNQVPLVADKMVINPQVLGHLAVLTRSKAVALWATQPQAGVVMES